MTDFFLTDVLNTPVLDKNGEEAGVLSDLAIAARGEIFPRVTAVQVRQGGRRKIYSVETVDLLSPRIVTLKIPLGQAAPQELGPEDLFLVQDFLDKQILDTHGAKVVRLNDLKIAFINGEFHLVGGDFGFRGLLRRLKLEKPVDRFLSLCGKRLHDQLLPWNFVEPISSRNPKVKLTVPHSKIGQLHPADIAEILTELSPPDRTAVLESLDKETAAEALHDVEPGLSLEILDDLPSEKAASILEEMSPDDAADILAELPEEQRQQVLRGMPSKEAGELKDLLRHHDEAAAGGLMTSEYICLSHDFTVEQTINRLREMSPQAETIYYLYVVDQENRLTGVVSLRDLIVAKPDTPLKSIMTTKVLKVLTTARKEEVSKLVAKYDLLALPVVDEADKLVGIITVDDVMDVLRPRRGRQRG